jgi:hypothetical protein
VGANAIEFTGDVSSLVGYFLGSQKAGVAFIAQGGYQAVDGSIRQTGRIERGAVNKVILHDIPNLPEHFKFRRLVRRPHYAWLQKVRVSKNYPGSKRRSREGQQTESNQSNFNKFFHEFVS